MVAYRMDDALLMITFGERPSRTPLLDEVLAVMLVQLKQQMDAEMRRMLFGHPDAPVPVTLERWEPEALSVTPALEAFLRDRHIPVRPFFPMRATE